MKKLCALLSAIALITSGALASDAVPGEPGAEGGIAILTKKALCVPLEGPQVVNNAVILIRDGKIEAVGPKSTTEIPAGYEVFDAGDNWVMPGMVDLHCHVAGTFDLNDMVYLTNPGLRASTSVDPGSPSLRKGLAAGVTSVLYIPGSGTNIGGQGVLLKTALGAYEAMEVETPTAVPFAGANRWVGYAGKSSASARAAAGRCERAQRLAALRHASACVAGNNAAARVPVQVPQSPCLSRLSVAAHFIQLRPRSLMIALLCVVSTGGTTPPGRGPHGASRAPHRRKRNDRCAPWIARARTAWRTTASASSSSPSSW